MGSTSMSLARHNYHAESEAAINRQINMELFCSYTYASMSSYFERDDIALYGFAKYFHKKSDEEKEDAEKLINYQNIRGGRVVLGDVKKPDHDDWGSSLDAMLTLMELQKKVNTSLLDVHEIASKHRDPQLTDFFEHEFLTKQVELLKEHADHITNLRRVGPGLGEYQFDRTTFASAS